VEKSKVIEGGDTMKERRNTIIIPADCLDAILDILNEASAEADELYALGARDYVDEVIEWLEMAQTIQDFQSITERLDRVWHLLSSSGSARFPCSYPDGSPHGVELDDAMSEIDAICTDLKSLDRMKGLQTALERMGD
jgi:hypothetical protein